MRANKLFICLTSLLHVACVNQPLSVEPPMPSLSEMAVTEGHNTNRAVQPPDVILAAMNRNYNENQNNCLERGSNLPRGHYYCSGVLVRTVNDGAFDPWMSSPNAIAIGATSYAWIRKDVRNTRLYHPAGFILRNKTEAIAGNLPGLETGFICLYPFDAGTGADQTHQGCGRRALRVSFPTNNPRHNNSAYAWGSCETSGIITVAQWDAHFESVAQNRGRQCSWNVDSQAAWNAMIASHAKYTTHTSIWNEIMLNNPADNGAGLPKYIAAFFYDVSLPAGKLIAQTFQRKLNAAGYVVPILKLSFLAPDASRFAYDPADQVVPQ
ncbi:hypothetical protein [Pseudomonas quasicaspiana]|uniref:hypothetical protein n=1 Tax=Pseudomonas quasicaspiana TaxID=2829821 RepID=UPI001E291FC8|nr:hypothetical protein [Pseudomonas quasicaspiana]MCD5980960.1 hypothetical protein [Pseudomonas quasicaspiana]